MHVEEERLLDLGVVEQVAQALGRHRGDGRAARSRRPASRVSDGLASTGNVLTLSHSATTAPAVPSRSSGETKRPGRGLDQHVGGDQAGAQRLRRASARPPAASVSRVVYAQSGPRGPVGLEQLRPQPDPALDRLVAVERERPADPGVDSSPRSVGGQLEPPLGRPVALARGLQEADRRPSSSALSGAAEHALRRAGGRRCSGSPPRRRAGRRSRTASASRSWSRPACTGRARSPRRAASRPALRGRSTQPRLRGLVEQLGDAASNVGEPRRALRRSQPRHGVRRGAGSSRDRGSASAIIRRQAATGIVKRTSGPTAPARAACRPSSSS